MEDYGIGSMINSATRMTQGYTVLVNKGDPLMMQFLQRESSILLGRAIRVWWNLRIGRRLPWRKTKQYCPLRLLGRLLHTHPHSTKQK